MARHEIPAVALALVLFAVPVLADDVILVNGAKLEGNAQRVGDEVVVVTPGGELRLPASEVREIVPGRTVLDDYSERAESVEADDADALVALGDWCAEQKLDGRAKQHWQAALRVDGDHADARKRLGFLRHDGRWVTQNEYRRLRGFVLVEGEWVHRDELARREQEQQARQELAAHRAKIQKCVKGMSSMKRKPRLLAKLELQEYAESIGDLKLASFASDVADYYNRAWTQVKRSLVKMEVRATQTKLKRPIDTLSTSLGANSNNVTIQLPELSVVSVRTTVLVPADIELDDE